MNRLQQTAVLTQYMVQQSDVFVETPVIMKKQDGSMGCLYIYLHWVVDFYGK